MIEKLAQLLLDSKHCVILSGAGLSTESGLADFRSKSNGLWNNRNPFELASIDAMEKNREEFISFYRERMKSIVKVRPHEGYSILTEWVEKGFIKSVITQNVDGFHATSGQTNVAELHGSLRSCHCNSCGSKYQMDLLMLSNNLTCRCGGFIRPSVVLFGESLPMEAIQFAEAETKKADLFIVLGSSLQVSPANIFPKLAKKNGAKLIIINKDPTPLDGIADLILNDRRIGEVLKETDTFLKNTNIKEVILKLGAEGGIISIVKELNKS